MVKSSSISLKRKKHFEKCNYLYIIKTRMPIHLLKRVRRK